MIGRSSQVSWLSWKRQPRRPGPAPVSRSTAPVLHDAGALRFAAKRSGRAHSQCASNGRDCSRREVVVAKRHGVSELRQAGAALRGERRIATVVFSDLAGYTALNEQLDPEDVIAALERVRAETFRLAL